MKGIFAIPNAFWSQPPDDLIAALESSKDGLTTSQAQERLMRYGKNLIKPKKKSTPLILFLNQFKSPIVLILLFATLVSAVLHDWVDAIIILLIVSRSAILSFIQENNANNSAEKLRSKISLRSDVLRDGQVQSIPTERIVPGDIVHLSAGSLVPADGILLEAKDPWSGGVFCDQHLEKFEIELGTEINS